MILQKSFPTYRAALLRTIFLTPWAFNEGLGTMTTSLMTDAKCRSRGRPAPQLFGGRRISHAW